MAIFQTFQPLYAENGIATFPMVITADCKKPAIRNYGKIGLPASSILAEKFSGQDALGFLAGAHSKITVVDIDDPGNEVLLGHMLEICGDTPVIIRTTSGGFHLYYRHGGEKRSIKPWAGLPVDLLGGGIVIAPPSIGPKGQYAFIKGGIDDLGALPLINDTNLVPPRHRQNPDGEAGGRNSALFKHLLQHARHVDGPGALFEVGQAFCDGQFAVPLPDKEIEKTANSAWKYQESGNNWVGEQSMIRMPRTLVELLAPTAPNALSLLSMLFANHLGLRRRFALANSFARSIGWSLSKFRRARGDLVQHGLIACVHRGGEGPNDPPIYEFGQGVNF